ncbi:hypothetical protein FQN54_008925 [Arachnomyces sp. PD_36]|nr:hypothetical protein FQN54_008925 [Arachnomyces sp. PD_36]
MSLNSASQAPIILPLSAIPKDRDFDVKDSSFFLKHAQLPSPQTVRSEARAQYLAGIRIDKRKHFDPAGLNLSPPPVIFESMGLFVKWGRRAQLSEGQTLYAVRRYLKNEVPVPEVYGWRTDGEEVFIYMEAIAGPTLEKSWDGLTPEDHVRICGELRKIFDNLRRLEQDPQERFIADTGPFKSVKEFHDWFAFLYRRPMADPHSVPIEPFRHILADDMGIKFTQGDLHRSNIILTASNPPKVASVVDWEQSAWMPAYWEDRKAHWTADYEGDWSEKYLPMILNQYTDTWEPWDYYTTSIGC